MIDHEKKLSNRRAFFTRLGTTSIAGTALLAGDKEAQAQTSSTDVDVVQFALNLEYLEAEFYSVATSGETIEQKGVGIIGSGTPGPTTGGQKVRFIHGPTFPGQVAAELAIDEREHVMFLRNLLNSMGVVPIAKPAINLDALGIGFANQTEFLTLARAFEDVGVTAYAAAAPLLTDSGHPRICGADSGRRIAPLGQYSAANREYEHPDNGIGRSRYFAPSVRDGVLSNRQQRVGRVADTTAGSLYRIRSRECDERWLFSVRR